MALVIFVIILTGITVFISTMKALVMSGADMRRGVTRVVAPHTRIAILSVSTPDRVQMYQAATNSKTCYAARHGYCLLDKFTKF